MPKLRTRGIHRMHTLNLRVYLLTPLPLFIKNCPMNAYPSVEEF